VKIEHIELRYVRIPLVTPFRTSFGTSHAKDTFLLRVVTPDAEGWAECAADLHPLYSAEFLPAAEIVLRDHLVPRAEAGGLGDARDVADALSAVRGHQCARAGLHLAVLDAQLRAADRSLASWLGAVATAVPAGAALGLHDDADDLLTEADEALAAGATRLRVKVAPGRAARHLTALRHHVGAELVLQADANGSFTEDDPELDELDEVALACLEQPLAPDDLLAHARLAERLHTPICLDEPLTSVAAIEAAVALGACEVVCLKPARVGSWTEAVRAHDRCVALGVPVWVGGLLETGVGRAANVAVAALPGMAPIGNERPPSVWFVSL
jgi:O-succinylbenzoate synthase